MGNRHDLASGPLARPTEPPSWAAAYFEWPDRSRDADTLSDVLQAVRLSGTLFFLVEAAPPWIAEAPASAALASVILPKVQHVVSYHVVMEGACWCRIRDREPVRLSAGDVIVVPHGDAYALASDPSVTSQFGLDDTLAWFRDMASGQLPIVVREGGAGTERIHVICGFLGCDALPFNPLLATLPQLLHVRRPPSAGRDRLDALIEFALSELRDKRAGSRSVLLRIGELMFVEVVRRYLMTVTETEAGWLAGLRDPLVGRALERLHAEPNRSWTLDQLARAVGASRSILVERFTHFVGQPPMHYLTQWRMQLAAGKLIDSAAKVSAVAREVGYDSDAAFSRAFKKLTGVAPADWRNRQAHRNTTT